MLFGLTKILGIMEHNINPMKKKLLRLGTIHEERTGLLKENAEKVK